MYILFINIETLYYQCEYYDINEQLLFVNKMILNKTVTQNKIEYILYI